MCVSLCVWVCMYMYNLNTLPPYIIITKKRNIKEEQNSHTRLKAHNIITQGGIVSDNTSFPNLGRSLSEKGNHGVAKKDGVVAKNEENSV